MKVWRYQSGNQQLSIEDKSKAQYKSTNNDLQNTTQKTIDRETTNGTGVYVIIR
jgi:hypothetical protein